MEKKQKEKNIVNSGIAGGAAETVQRYGSAVKEHVVAYSGKDNENNITLNRSLKSISKQKVNPEYKSQNLKQQAGFSAEVKETANSNAESIINGKTSRKIRSDDLGKVNDPLYDHFELDASGNIISGSGSQMKFVGSDAKEALKKLTSKKFEKYIDNDVKIEVPSDYYQDILTEADNKITDLQKQLDKQIDLGNTNKAKNIQKKIDDCKKLKKNLKKSSVSNDEAMEARLNPELSTAKSITNVSHRAGIDTAKNSTLIGGSVSIVQNLVAVVKGDVEVEDAAKNVAFDTGTAAVTGYATGFAGSFIKGTMQNASSNTVQTLSKTNLPATVVAVGISAFKTMKRYFGGEISGLECFEELGEQGTGMVSSSLFAAIGNSIPGLVAGGLIGGMLGYAVASASYRTLMDSLKNADLAKEQRLETEKACEEQILLIRSYRSEIEKIVNEYLISNMTIFQNSFDDIKTALAIGDIDGYILGANTISEALGRTPQFQTMDEFDTIMNSDSTFKL